MDLHLKTFVAALTCLCLFSIFLHRFPMLYNNNNKNIKKCNCLWKCIDCKYTLHIRTHLHDRSTVHHKVVATNKAFVPPVVFFVFLIFSLPFFFALSCTPLFMLLCVGLSMHV